MTALLGICPLCGHARPLGPRGVHHPQPGRHPLTVVLRPPSAIPFRGEGGCEACGAELTVSEAEGVNPVLLEELQP